jgi:hypothetical protein
MFRSRLADAAIVGCLTAAACFCALSARAEEPYAIVAQSSLSSATTGRRPLADRIVSANLPIISETELRQNHAPEHASKHPAAKPDESRAESQVAAGRAGGSRPVSGQPAKPAKDGQVARRVEAGPAAENMAVAAVPVEHLEQHAQQSAAEVPAQKPAATSVWPFNGKWPTVPWTGSAKTTIQAGGPHGTAASHAAHANRTPGHGSIPAQPQAAVAVRKSSGPSAARPGSAGTSASRQTGSSDAAQRTARSSGKGLSDSSPASVTR